MQTDAATPTLDVRPILANGDEPFVTILETAYPIPVSQSFLLIAPFETVPLYAVLEARGFSHQTEKISDAEWHMLFTRVAPDPNA